MRIPRHLQSLYRHQRDPFRESEELPLRSASQQPYLRGLQRCQNKMVPVAVQHPDEQLDKRPRSLIKSSTSCFKRRDSESRVTPTRSRWSGGLLFSGGSCWQVQFFASASSNCLFRRAIDTIHSTGTPILQTENDSRISADARIINQGLSPNGNDPYDSLPPETGPTEEAAIKSKGAAAGDGRKKIRAIIAALGVSPTLSRHPSHEHSRDSCGRRRRRGTRRSKSQTPQHPHAARRMPRRALCKVRWSGKAEEVVQIVEMLGGVDLNANESASGQRRRSSASAPENATSGTSRAAKEAGGAQLAVQRS
ncbi:hypothetical protein DFJ73DRAFT_104014 [Zopfochytrium polystomum]|nr:hypothetical protein DFJ73DRAFT_104014 [Zopfochytrium polystomum]